MLNSRFKVCKSEEVDYMKHKKGYLKWFSDVKQSSQDSEERGSHSFEKERRQKRK